MGVRRSLAVLALVCLITAIFGACVYAKPAPYVIGAVFDVTGPASPLGTPEKDTINMLQAQINKAGGIKGHPVKFIVLDNGSEETKCVMAVKRLIEAEKVSAIIGPSTTGTTLAVAPMCQKSGIPLVSCAAGIKITQPAKPYVFKTAQADMHAIAKLIDYLKAKHIKRIAFISDSNAFGSSGKQQIEMQAPKKGIQIVAEEQFGSKDTDMTAQLTRIASKKPQAVICWGTNPGPAIIAKNMKQLRMKMPLMMSHGIANKKFIELAGDAANGVVFPTGRVTVASSLPNSDPQKKTLLTFASQFKKQYKRDADGFGGYAWDSAKLVLNAMQKVGNNPSKVRSELEKTKHYVGVSGVFNFSAKDHNGLNKQAFVMVQIKNGKWVLLK